MVWQLTAFNILASEVNKCLIGFARLGWLDDIGLPQYKDHFHEARVDGRMIQYITVVRHVLLKWWRESRCINMWDVI